eukprot:1173399-Prorocentrum_minimum.AAC.1
MSAVASSSSMRRAPATCTERQQQLLVAMRDHLTGQCTTEELGEKHPQVDADEVIAKVEAIKKQKLPNESTQSLATERALHRAAGLSVYRMYTDTELELALVGSMVGTYSDAENRRMVQPEVSRLYGIPRRTLKRHKKNIREDQRLVNTDAPHLVSVIHAYVNEQGAHTSRPEPQAPVATSSSSPPPVLPPVAPAAAFAAAFPAACNTAPAFPPPRQPLGVITNRCTAPHNAHTKPATTSLITSCTRLCIAAACGNTIPVTRR